jgi:NAD-dependent SIR2 family protein deacetylase
MLIVMGTSLRIAPLKVMVKQLASKVRNRGGQCVLVNRTEVSSLKGWRDLFDYHVQDEVDSWVEETVACWKEAHPKDWELGPVHPNLLKRYSLLRGPAEIGKS